MRVLVDLGWWIETPLGSLGVLWSASLLLVCGGLVARNPSPVVRHPLRWPALAWCAVVLLALARSGPATEALAWTAHLLLPVAWLAAWAACESRPDPLPVWVGGLTVPVLLGLVALALGQPWEHTLHGWPRLLGAYGNLHTHAGVMAVGGVSALALAATGPRWAWIIALGAVGCLVATFVRIAWLWACIAALGTWFAYRGVGPRSVGVAAALGIVAVGLALISGRLADGVALFTATPPPGGWGQLGSSRVEIWVGTAQAWSTDSGIDRFLGAGLGSHLGRYRHFDPHSEWLSVLLQVGGLGLAVWAWGLAAALRLAWRTARRSPHVMASLAFGLIAGAVATAPLSNDWLTRTTVVLWGWGCLGWALPGPGSEIARERQPPTG